ARQRVVRIHRNGIANESQSALVGSRRFLALPRGPAIGIAEVGPEAVVVGSLRRRGFEDRHRIGVMTEIKLAGSEVRIPAARRIDADGTLRRAHGLFVMSE